MHIGEVPVDSHFFADLGADSLVMAHFCARVTQTRRPAVSVDERHLLPPHHRQPGDRAHAGRARPAGRHGPRPGNGGAPAPAEKAPHATTAQYVTCGALQFLFFAACVYLAALVVGWGADWVSAPSGLADIYLRAVLFGGAAFVAACVLPVIAKWALIGRWTERQIRIWSLGYVRFWIVKTLIRSSLAAVMFSGSPLYVMYLRALGVRIGRGTVIWSRHVPVCTDLLTIGAGTVIRKDAFLQCYRAQAGWIQAGQVTLGRDCFVGETGRARHQHRDRRPGTARPLLRAALRASRYRPASDGTGPRRSRARWTTWPSRRPAAAGCGRRAIAPSRWPSCFWCTCRWPRPASTCC